MTSVTFESATIIDAVQKAAAIAPGKSGIAFDKAAGLLLQITPGSEVKVLIRATNLEIFHSEVIGCSEADGPDVLWRLPSRLLADVLKSLPMGTGRTIKFVDAGLRVEVTSARMKLVIPKMDASFYPDWEMFEETSMTTVSALGGKIALVEWAADAAAGPPFGAVYLDGEFCIATDRYKLVKVPLEIKLDQAVMIPKGLSGTLRQLGDVNIQVSGGRLQIMPDEYTQLECILYDGMYIPWRAVAKTDYPMEVTVDKAHVLDVINRANAVAGADRMPVVKMYFGRGEIAAYMNNQEQGLLGDVIEVPGQIPHTRVELRFTPKYITDCITHAPSQKVILKYDPENPDRPFHVDGGSGYEAWVLPRKVENRKEP